PFNTPGVFPIGIFNAFAAGTSTLSYPTECSDITFKCLHSFKKNESILLWPADKSASLRLQNSINSCWVNDLFSFHSTISNPAFFNFCKPVSGIFRVIKTFIFLNLFSRCHLPPDPAKGFRRYTQVGSNHVLGQALKASGKIFYKFC